MKRLLRVIILLLLLVVVASVIYTQTGILTPSYPASQVVHSDAPSAAHAVAQIATHEMPVPAPSPVMGSESAPLYVRLADADAQLQKNAQDRQAEQNLEHYAMRIAASSLAQNIVMCVEAVLLLLILIVLYMLVESIKRLTVTAEKAMESAAVRQQAKPVRPVKHPPHHYRKR